MSSLPGCCERLARLDPHTPPKWGRMNAHQMVCHLNDSFRVATGERHASPASNVFQRTVVKWIALHTPMKWPQGVPTRPEIDQKKGGTPPKDWARDVSELRALIESFPNRKNFGTHPIFGKMSREDWMIWGYRHADHHLRQFGV
jgi:hypothetical protein